MAAHEVGQKLKRNRKTRIAEGAYFPHFATKILVNKIAVSPEGSSSEIEADSMAQDNPSQRERANHDDTNMMDAARPNATENNGDEHAIKSQPRSTDPEQAFDEFYLKQATKEFSNDLDKLRSASDFNPRSVPILIEGLRQKRACFSAEERRRIGLVDLSEESGG